MAKESISALIAQLHLSKISRREFAKRAAGAGLAAGLVGQVLRAADVAAQDMPEATKIGVQGVTYTTDTSKGTIKLFSSWPLTGSYATLGPDAVAAVNLCLSDFGGAAGGYALNYEALDDGVAANNGGWEAGKETENVNKVINDADVMVYMATYNSGAAKIVIPITNEAGLAQISYANTYPGLTRVVEGVTEAGEPEIYYPSGKRNYMRVCPADDIQGAAAANWAFTEMGKKKAYILHDKSLYGKGVAAVFQVRFLELGGEVLGFEGYEPLTGPYNTVMASIADKGPDLLYVGATVENNAAEVVTAMRDVMSVDDVMFLGPDGLNNDAFITGAADAAEGGWVTFAGYTPDKLLELGGPGGDYVTRITEILGHSPDAYAVYAYETTVAIKQAITVAGEKDRTKILDALWATEGFVSLLGGTWSFTDSGDTDSAIIGLSQITGGKIVYNKAIS